MTAATRAPGRTVRRTRLILAAYAAGVLLVSLLHDPRLLAVALAAVLLLAGRDAGRILRRAAVAVAIFTGVVVGAYVATGLWRGDDPWPWALRTILRVLTLTSATLLLGRRVAPLDLAAGSPTLQTVLVLVLAQMATLRRTLRDARLALWSRSLDRPRPRVLLRHAGACGGSLLRKARHDLTRTTDAMASRGYFLDADPD
jgi:cobalt/nickel transport system permease protein